VVGTLPSLLGIAGVSHSPAGRVVVGLEDRVNPYRGVRRPPGLLRIRPLRAPTRVPWPIPTADRNAERPARPTAVGDPRPSDSRFAARGRIWPTLAGRPHTPTNEQGNVPLRPHHLLLNHPEVDFIPTLYRKRADFGDLAETTNQRRLAEIAGGLGVLFVPLRRAAAWGLIALLIAIFPANVHMAIDDLAGKGIAPWILWSRLPFQLVFIAWVYWTCLTDSVVAYRARD